MRIRNLDIGVEQVTQWGAEHEFHLPPEGDFAPAFLPQIRPLDEILRRPSLDERLPDLLQPAELDPSLLSPPVFAETRKSTRDFFRRMARSTSGEAARILDAASHILDAEDGMDGEVRAALAMLLRG